MFARLKNDKDVFLFLTPRAWTEHFPQWQGSLSVVVGGLSMRRRSVFSFRVVCLALPMECM